MNLPKLTVLNDGADIDVSTCGGLDGCIECPLFVKNNGRCDGCTNTKRAELLDNYHACYQECHECTGFDVEVTSICCRSPLRDTYLTAVTKGAADWNRPKYDFTKRETITAENKAIFYVTAGSISTLIEPGGYLVPEDTELVAVSLARVWSGRKFASQDLHDYLKIPSNTKLALLTMNKDDALEQAWEKEMYADPLEYQRVGFSYWMPIAFSAYWNEAHMQQYFSFLRTLYTADKSESWWAVGNYKRPGLQLDDMMLEWVEASPQVIFNVQFLVNDKILRRALGNIKHYHKLLDADVPFWFVGTATPTFCHNVRKIVGAHRPLYFVSGNPHHHSTQGKEMLITSKGVSSKLSKPEVLRKNIETYSQMVRQYG